MAPGKGARPSCRGAAQYEKPLSAVDRRSWLGIAGEHRRWHQLNPDVVSVIQQASSVVSTVCGQHAQVLQRLQVLRAGQVRSWAGW
jgi:hypothetical protein